MQEYQALAESAVAALQAGATPTWAYLAGPVVAGLVGIVQCGLVAWGIRVMGKSNVERAANAQLMIQQGKALERLLERG